MNKVDYYYYYYYHYYYYYLFYDMLCIIRYFVHTFKVLGNFTTGLRGGPIFLPRKFGPSFSSRIGRSLINLVLH